MNDKFTKLINQCTNQFTYSQIIEGLHFALNATDDVTKKELISRLIEKIESEPENIIQVLKQADIILSYNTSLSAKLSRSLSTLSLPSLPKLSSSLSSSDELAISEPSTSSSSFSNLPSTTSYQAANNSFDTARKLLKIDDQEWYSLFEEKTSTDITQEISLYTYKELSIQPTLINDHGNKKEYLSMSNTNDTNLESNLNINKSSPIKVFLYEETKPMPSIIIGSHRD